MSSTVAAILVFSLSDVFGNQFRVRLPQTVEAVTGSCLTIPCSFEIKSEYEKHLNKKCEAKWQSTTEHNVKQTTNLKLTTTKDMMGDLTKKNCTSTFKNINPKHSDQYHFRLDCANPMIIILKSVIFFRQCIFLPDVPPSPTLTPPAQEVKEGTSVSLTCSAPASCLLHPPSLTWTPKLAHSQETLKENQDQTKVQISVLNFTASHLHHGKRITCTAVYWKHGGSNVSVNSSLTAAVKFPPWIRPFSNCTKAGNQINCSCETEGNPAPTLSWSLNGKTINQSDTIEINTDSPNSTYLRSSIILSLSQKKDFSALICFSLNSLGSTEHQFSLNDLNAPGESTAYITIIQRNSMINIQNICGKKEFFTQAKDFF
uniref:Ig-like domain-containing protein n=1 Tax=Oryzias latipes TaxID=8090 RepID=A0A3P9L888_ORYLA